MKRLALMLAALPAALAAQPPGPLDSDTRIETIEWRQDAALPLRTTVGGNLTIVFAPGEAVQTVLVGDPLAVEVDVAPQVDSILVRVLRQPIDARLEVRSQLRTYHLRLDLRPPNDVAYAVRFNVAPAIGPVNEVALPPSGAMASYSIKGWAELRPAKVSDDGTRTYIEWRTDQALPAVFAINTLGEEETVDSYIRQGVMVIDRVYPKLIFRIGKRNAQASRLPEAKTR